MRPSRAPLRVWGEHTHSLWMVTQAQALRPALCREGLSAQLSLGVGRGGTRPGAEVFIPHHQPPVLAFSLSPSETSSIFFCYGSLLERGRHLTQSLPDVFLMFSSRLFSLAGLLLQRPSAFTCTDEVCRPDPS